MSEMKKCPDLTRIVWEKAIMVGKGDFQRIILNDCITNHCAAYKNGKCMKYGTEITEVSE